MFDSPSKMLLGLAIGFAFGFLLQKGRVTKFEVIVGQFLLRDFTVLKVMLTAIVVGAVGVYALHGAGLATLSIKPALLVAIATGGVVFGFGMALLGYCPGTAVGAMAEGSRHAIAGVLGMLAGAALYAEAFGFLSGTLLKMANFGTKTLPDVTGIPAWAMIAALAAVAGLVFAAVERREKRLRGTVG